MKIAQEWKKKKKESVEGRKEVWQKREERQLQITIFLNLNPKILKKILAHQIKQLQKGFFITIKNSTNIAFYVEYQVDSLFKKIHQYSQYINSLKKIKHVTILVYIRKAFHEIQHTVIIKTFNKPGTERDFLKLESIPTKHLQLTISLVAGDVVICLKHQI